MGRNAYAWIDFLRETRQQLWQILPLGPVAYGNCPYQCFSAFAGNPLMIDLHGRIRRAGIGGSTCTENAPDSNESIEARN